MLNLVPSIRPKNSCSGTEQTNRNRQVLVVEFLVGLSCAFTWLDFLPRAIAVSGYPLDIYDPILLASLWPASMARGIAVFFFWISGLGIAVLWINSRWAALLTAFFFTEFVCIYWSFFPSASHGANLPLLSLWLMAIYKFDSTRLGFAFVFSVQLLVAIMLASAAIFKWRNSGFYWTDGLEMHRRIFKSYAHDGRPTAFFTEILMRSPSAARAAGVIELLCQTATLPLMLIAARWPKIRYLSGSSAVVAVSGIHFGMQLFFFQFVPLALALFVPLKSTPTRNLKTPLFVIMAALLVTDVIVSVWNWNWMRDAFPLASNPMYSTSGYPEEVTRLRHPRPEELDFVQREFFLLFAHRSMSADLDQIAIAHRLNPDELKWCTFDIESFREDVKSVGQCDGQ